MTDIAFMDGALRQLPALFQLANEFAANMLINMLAATIPLVLGIASTLFLGWGFGIAVVLSQVNLPVGVYNALRPLFDEEKRRQTLLAPQRYTMKLFVLGIYSHDKVKG